MDGKSQAWRDAADKLLEALARENKYIVADMVIVFLESAGYGLPDYSPLGGVFKRAAKRGIIRKIDRRTKPALWLSKIYNSPQNSALLELDLNIYKHIPDIHKGKIIYLENFGTYDGKYRVVHIIDNKVSLEAVI